MYVVRRLAFVAVLLVALSMLLFYILHLLPGSPEEVLLASNPNLRAEEVERIRTLRGLDRPIHVRYVCWLFGRGGRPIGESDGACSFWPSESGILGGDLGWSHAYKVPVGEVLGQRLFTTLGLMVPTFLLSLLTSLVLGVQAARRSGRTADRAIAAFCFGAMSVPAHWLALLSILIFAVALGWFPAGGVRAPMSSGAGSLLDHAVLPVCVLSVGLTARWTRFVRSSILEVLHLDYVRTARASGLSERDIVLKHVLPNALLPLITVIAHSAPALFSGALIVETVFSYPGMGSLIWESLVKDDHLVAIVVLLLYAGLALLFALLADLTYAFLDPRIRLGKEALV